MEALPAR